MKRVGLAGSTRTYPGLTGVPVTVHETGCGVPTAIAPAPATAPTAPVGVASITADDVRGRIYRIADDSMRGRATPSPELDKMAAYVAGEFRRFGLRPGGDSGGYLQRYPLEVYQAV